MTYTDLPCRTCKAPVGRHCVDRRGVTAVATCRSRVRDVDNVFLVSAGYHPLKGALDD